MCDYHENPIVNIYTPPTHHHHAKYAEKHPYTAPSTLMLPAGSRRSKIRPPRKSLASLDSGSDSGLDYDSSWSVLASAIVQIQNKNVFNLLYEQLYRKSYTLVLRKFGGRLYEDVAQLIASHLKTRRQALLRAFDSTLTWSNEDFLKAVVKEWAENMQLMKFISDVLMYLNRVYVKENKKLLIYDLGLVLFDVNVIRLNGMEVGLKLIDVVLDEISKSRRGHVITTRLYISQIITMLEMLLEEHPGTSASLPNAPHGDSLYLQHFEPAFMTSSEQFFSTLASEYMLPLQGTSYLHHVHRFVHDEENRLKFFVPTELYPKLVALMNNILIRDKIDKIICLPVEQQGLLFWLDPVLHKTFSKINNSQTTSIRDNGAELHILYLLMGRIESDRKLFKLRLKDAIYVQGVSLPETVLAHLEQQASASAAAGLKKSSVNATSAAFATRWIDTVLEYQAQFQNLVKDAFESDASVEHTIFSAMRDFINTSNLAPTKKRLAIVPTTNAPELLLVYMDFHIKQLTKSAGAKRTVNEANVSVDETEDFINRAMAFLKFVKDKDAFEVHYAAHFAKRFLNAKNSAVSASGGNYGSDLEELVIAKLGEELGSASLEKIIRMKKDVKLSAELTLEWKNHVSSHQIKLVDLELKICNVSDWPKSMTKDYQSFVSLDGDVGFIWPAQLRETMRTFEEYWLTGKRNDNKSLFWSPKFGLMDLRITYPSRTYDINMSTYAGIIMLLFAPQSSDAGRPVLAFEEKRQLTYEEICELTKIPESDLKRQLQLIAVAPRLRLLVKTPMSKDINAGDTFKLNSGFKSPTSKVKVLTVSLASSKELAKKSDKQEEVDEVRVNIEEGRKHIVNAAIVRIMKACQTINHNDLIAQLVKQLHNRFQPSTLLIKQRIEDLIEKEYLKRDDDVASVYHYIA